MVLKINLCQCLKGQQTYVKMVKNSAPLLFPFRAKELLHKGSALFRKDPFDQLRFGVEGPGADAKPVVMAAGGAAYSPPVPVLLILRPEDHTADLAPIQCSGAHQAGFHRYIDGGTRQVFTSQMIKGGCEGDDLCVGGSIRQAFGLVMSPGNDLVLHHDDGADGHFVFGIGPVRLFQRLLHVVFVVHESDEDRAKKLTYIRDFM